MLHNEFYMQKCFVRVFTFIREDHSHEMHLKRGRIKLIYDSEKQTLSPSSSLCSYFFFFCPPHTDPQNTHTHAHMPTHTHTTLCAGNLQHAASEHLKISHNNFANAKLGGNKRVNKQTNTHSQRAHDSTEKWTCTCTSLHASIHPPTYTLTRSQCDVKCINN